ncbi:MAG: bifunctional ADP-dependent NAD(P)H-hydrate dehydratase/NAD(P)H-hydrate epimerase, partial [Solirubrobacterales bacterium]|nr:bifunctional ADP-dependent NAD(P)H-hydrate dehydratase/NAD(P)H-hydrate epimerase [Solirubrobacterales bacterium]
MTLPAWLEVLPDADGMRETDRWLIEERGVDPLELMERAGVGLAQAVRDVARDGPVAIVCGSGGNGGDGLVAARHLAAEGRRVRVLLVGDPALRRADAAANLARLSMVAEPFAPQALVDATVVVDAVLGSGATGAPRDAAAAAIAAMD